MKNLSQICLLVFVIFAVNFSVKSQTITGLIYFDVDSIPRGKPSLIDGKEELGGLSGIEYSKKDACYYAISDGVGNRRNYFSFQIKFSDSEIKITDLHPIDIVDNENYTGESIRKKNENIYISTEFINGGKCDSKVIKLISYNNHETITSETNENLYNDGYEGLAFNSSGDNFYVSFEREKKDFGYTHIDKYVIDKLSKKFIKSKRFIYELTKNMDNSYSGISELLMWDDNTLICVERYYSKENGMNVYVYKIDLTSIKNDTITAKDKVQLGDFNLVNKKLNGFLDNVEGVCISADGNYLIFVTDNNFNEYKSKTAQYPSGQQTQFIAMKIVR